MSTSSNLVVVCFVLAVAFVIARPQPAAASQEDPHRMEMRTEGGHHVAEIPPADNPAQVWGELRAKRDVIENLVWEAKLDKIHAETEGMAALGAKLLSASATLEGSKRARVEGAVNQLPKATDRLQDVADTNDAQNTAAEFKKLDDLLQLIAAQYPPELLAASGEPRSHHPNKRDAAKPSEHAHHGGGEGEPTEMPENAQVLSVSAYDFRFDPVELVVQRAVPVALTLINRGKNEHAWVIESRPEVHLHAMVGGNHTKVFTLANPGEYPIRCTVPGHTELGMMGKLVVK